MTTVGVYEHVSGSRPAGLWAKSIWEVRMAFPGSKPKLVERTERLRELRDYEAGKEGMAGETVSESVVRPFRRRKRKRERRSR